MKLANFQAATLKASEGIAPKRQEIIQTFVSSSILLPIHPSIHPMGNTKKGKIKQNRNVGAFLAGQIKMLRANSFIHTLKCRYETGYWSAQSSILLMDNIQVLKMTAGS